MRIHAEEALPEVSAGAPLESGAKKLDAVSEARRLPCDSILLESQLVSSKLLTFVSILVAFWSVCFCMSLLTTQVDLWGGHRGQLAEWRNLSL